MKVFCRSSTLYLLVGILVGRSTSYFVSSPEKDLDAATRGPFIDFAGTPGHQVSRAPPLMSLALHDTELLSPVLGGSSVGLWGDVVGALIAGCWIPDELNSNVPRSSAELLP